jgi:hypothetical protein
VGGSTCRHGRGLAPEGRDVVANTKARGRLATWVRTEEGVPSDDRWEQFDGYGPPRYTLVPDHLFDRQLRDLGLAELKVLLFIMRKTL